MARDPRFVAIHRGGLLEPKLHRLLARWAAACAEHAHRQVCEEALDSRPLTAIAAARSWSRGEASVGAARAAAFAAHAAARAEADPARRAAARAAGHAAATAHMADHATHAAAYALNALRAAAPQGSDRKAAGEAGARWQRDQLAPEIRQLVVSTRSAQRQPDPPSLPPDPSVG